MKVLAEKVPLNESLLEGISGQTVLQLLLLRDVLLQLYYYAAMLADVLLRVSWAINILLAQMKDSSAAATASALLAPLEVLRFDFSHTL